MAFLVDLLTNKLFIAPACAWIFSNIIKILIDTIKSGFCKERLHNGVGMPSSLAAAATSLIIMTGAVYGGGSFEFAVSLFLGFIIIYDSRWVRYESGRQGKALNNLNEERMEEGKQPLDIIKFREKLGHTYNELIAGIIFGIICGIAVYHLPI